MDRSIFIVGLFFLVPLFSFGQEVIVRPVEAISDTADIESVLPANAPRKAFLYSALLPGMGQAYNNQYWKVPVVYGGFVGLGYMISFYNSRYGIYKSELFNLLEDPGFVPPSGATEEQLRRVIDTARRNRDNMIVMASLFYVLQIVDAHVDAHLREFDLNPDLQLELQPVSESVLAGNVFGVGIVLKFKP